MTIVRTSPSGPLVAGGAPPLYWGSDGVDSESPFLIPFDTGLVAPTATLAEAQILVLYDCKLRRLLVGTTVGLVTDNAVVFQVLKNGAVTDLVATLAVGESLASDDEHEVECLRGDLIAISTSTGGTSVAGVLAGLEVL